MRIETTKLMDLLPMEYEALLIKSIIQEDIE